MERQRAINSKTKTLDIGQKKIKQKDKKEKLKDKRLTEKGDE